MKHTHIHTHLFKCVCARVRVGVCNFTVFGYLVCKTNFNFTPFDVTQYTEEVITYIKLLLFSITSIILYTYQFQCCGLLGHYLLKPFSIVGVLLIKRFKNFVLFGHF